MSAVSSSMTVIGGGIVGICCASYLQREGFSVTVVDRGTPEARCSYGNAGSLSGGSVAPLAMPGILAKVPGMLLDPTGPLFIRPGYLPRVTPWLLRFARAASRDRVERISRALAALLSPAIDAYAPLMKDTGDDTLIKRTGQLQLYPDEAALKADSAGWQLRRERGVRFETVGWDEIRQLEPEIGPAYRCGVFLPDEGFVVNPQRQLDLLTQAFVRNGGRYLRQEVRGFEFGADGPKALRLDGEAMPVERLVVAAGAWAGRLAAQLGSKVPIETQRGYHLTLRDAGVNLRRPVVAADRKCFVTAMETGLRLAGTVEFAGLEAPPDPRRARVLLDHGRRLLPGLRGDSGTEWMGHRPCLPDSLPVIDRSPVHAQTYFAFGHGHLGLTGAAVTGRHLAALVAGRKPDIDLTPFRIDRFTR